MARVLKIVGLIFLLGSLLFLGGTAWLTYEFAKAGWDRRTKDSLDWSPATDSRFEQVSEETVYQALITAFESVGMTVCFNDRNLWYTPQFEVPCHESMGYGTSLERGRVYAELQQKKANCERPYVTQFATFFFIPAGDDVLYRGEFGERHWVNISPECDAKWSYEQTRTLEQLFHLELQKQME